MQIGIVIETEQAIKAFEAVIESMGDQEIAWITRSGSEAVERCALLRPDIIMIDLKLADVEIVKSICSMTRDYPCAIIAVIDRVPGNEGKIFDAMGHGVLDALVVPSFGPRGEITGKEEIIKKITTMEKLLGKGKERISSREETPLVAIGSSTGGPRALVEILSRIPAMPDIPIVIVQHIDAEFAENLTGWLGEQAGVPVMIAQEGGRPEGGKVFMAGANDHLVIGRDLAFHYVVDPVDYPYRPSVDVFFESLRSNWPGRGVAVLLTGMGRDGAKGLLGLYKSGWHTIAQDDKTSTVYGMPKAAADLGAAGEILPIGKIAGAVVKHIKAGDRRQETEDRRQKAEGRR